MAASGPNVLFILVDQMREEAMGCSGNGVVRTPRLDALAGEGVRFTDAVANCPVCTPSRAMLMTGKYPLSNGTLVNDLPMPTEQPFVAEIARDAGYRTGYIGKWHLDGIPREKFTPPGKRRAGFDTYWAGYNCHHNYFEPKYYLDTDELVTAPGYEPVVQTDLAIDFMTRHRDEPFLLVLAWGPPHAPCHLVPESYRAAYRPDEIAYRANCRDTDTREYCDYYAQITALDDQVGRLVAFLDRAGLADNTLVVFTSDHGDMLWSHGRVKKQQPWEESVHIPLIMRWPDGLPRGGESNQLIGMADMGPTVLGLMGLEPAPEMEGVDMSSALVGGPPAHTSLPIFDYVPADQALQWGGREWRGVRTRTHTYARFMDAGWVLYDNVNDPYQFENLIDRDEYRPLQSELEAELQGWMKRLGDDFLPAEDHLRALGQYDLWVERNAHFPWSRNRKR
ncbi:MAG: sulfatase [Candidatus Hydrogenedentes bacterium]|nr:sulfatase [Candidatus Hydrogenedentota bacterium]